MAKTWLNKPRVWVHIAQQSFIKRREQSSIATKTMISLGIIPETMLILKSWMNQIKETFSCLFCECFWVFFCAWMLLYQQISKMCLRFHDLLKCVSMHNQLWVCFFIQMKGIILRNSCFSYYINQEKQAWESHKLLYLNNSHTNRWKEHVCICVCAIFLTSVKSVYVY